jgi:hypothetical protein
MQGGATTAKALKARKGATTVPSVAWVLQLAAWSQEVSHQQANS